MKLTKLQFKVLKVWLRLHASGGYGLGQFFRNCWWPWLLLGIMGAWSYFFVVSITPTAGWIFLGICLGAFLRDIGYYQQHRRVWPITDRVIDWRQVQELVDSHKK